MSLALDIVVNSTLRTDQGPGRSCCHPLVLSDSGIEGDIVVSGNDRQRAINQRIKVTFEGKSFSLDTAYGIRRLTASDTPQGT